MNDLTSWVVVVVAIPTYYYVFYLENIWLTVVKYTPRIYLMYVPLSCEDHLSSHDQPSFQVTAELVTYSP